MANKNLQAAKAAKKDEFYTQLTDIEKELRHYKEHFQGKTVLCNCDDPRVSNFYKYFSMNFEHLGLKRLICTCYKHQEVDLFSDHTSEKAVYIDYIGGDENILPLKGDGDFRSQECIELLKQADIVVTNPPFSLFREYVAQLMKYEKKFLIIGNFGAISYKDFFPLLKENKVWLGYGFQAGNAYFRIPPEQSHNYADGVYNEETGLVKFRNCTWFTNIDHDKRHESLLLYKKYNECDYKQYDNYDAIEVSKTAEIPEDYFGNMGVPITFLDKYCPDQFEIVGNEDILNVSKGRFYLNGKRLYARIIIRRKQ